MLRVMNTDSLLNRIAILIVIFLTSHIILAHIIELSIEQTCLYVHKSEILRSNETKYCQHLEVYFYVILHELG